MNPTETTRYVLNLFEETSKVVIYDQIDNVSHDMKDLAEAQIFLDKNDPDFKWGEILDQYRSKGWK